MLYTLTADLLVLLHFAFVCFVVAGGLLLLRWWRLVYLHLPAVVWAILLEFNGWICPLTPLEQQLRQAAGVEIYREGFIEHYLLPVLYPAGLTRGMQLWLGIAVLLINLCLYGWCLWHKRHMLQ